MRKSLIVAVCAAAASAALSVCLANADTSCGTLENPNASRTGTVYVTKGGASCSAARATILGALTGPTVDVSGTGRGRQFTDSSGTVWSLYWPGAAEDDQRLKVWNDNVGSEFAWG
jgi:hypothetical protein